MGAMETASGEMELFLRALDGFPECRDSQARLSDLQDVYIELVLRFVSHSDDTGDGRFVRLTRSLADMVQLEQRTNGSASSQPEQRSISIVSKIVEEYKRALPRPRFGSISQQTDRLMWQLESFLTSILKQTPNAPAVKAFFGHQAISFMEHKEIVERCLFLGRGDSNDVQEATIASGSTHHEDVEVVSTDAALLLWKFKSEDASTLDFTVVWRPNEVSVDARDTATDVDPYSVEAVAWAQNEAEAEYTKHITLQYSTEYTSSDQWIYGACFAPRDPATINATVAFEWTNADTASILSKHLQFQVACVNASESAGNADFASLCKLFENDGSADASDSLAWLEEMLAASTACEWPVEKSGHDDEDLTIDEADSQSGVPQNQDTKHNDVRVFALENQVLELQKELRTVGQELKSAKSELEISSEIYKASLETISQLETQAAVPRPPSQPSSAATRKASFDELFNSEGENDEVSDDEEAANELGLDSEDEAEGEPTDAETNRLRGLVATFQEQCLWRSIETTESEKRGLLLELELKRVDDQVKTLTTTLAEKNKKLDELRSENQKLKVHKAVLVQEVKRLQPYSQVNLATLVHEAEEARMMQRSLQAQLNALMAATPETDHPQSM